MPFISPNKVRLVYNAITESTFVGRESARRFLKEQTKKEKHVFPSRATWIGTISELCRNKGLEHLIWAVRDVVERNPKTLCIIVGEGELRPSLTQLIGHLGLEKHVFLAGYVVNAASYLKALDIFTLTSVKEGHPYTLLEAGWAGSAVVGSDIPGITDTVDDMSSGVLVRPGNSQEIAEALELLIKSPEKRKEFGDSLKKTVTERFSLEAMIAATQKVYEC